MHDTVNLVAQKQSLKTGRITNIANLQRCSFRNRLTVSGGQIIQYHYPVTFVQKRPDYMGPDIAGPAAN